MRKVLLAMFGMLAAASVAAAQGIVVQHSISLQEIVPAVPGDPCELPGYLLVGDARLDGVARAARARKELNILVLGTGSSALAGGGTKSYPRRLEESLKRRFPELAVHVVPEAKPRLKAADMIGNLEKLLLDRKPDLVVWQTGTVDAIRGVDPDDFRHTLDEGIDAIHAAGADAVLMNMQYSPRTESMIPVASFADNMRIVARDRDVPLFNRLEIMRYWNDNGNFNFNTPTKDSAMAQKVHDCIGRALAALIIEAARLDHMKDHPTQ
jgi:hypothetical protein